MMVSKQLASIGLVDMKIAPTSLRQVNLNQPDARDAGMTDPPNQARPTQLVGRATSWICR